MDRSKYILRQAAKSINGQQGKNGSANRVASIYDAENKKFGYTHFQRFQCGFEACKAPPRTSDS